METRSQFYCKLDINYPFISLKTIVSGKLRYAKSTSKHNRAEIGLLVSRMEIVM